MIYEQRVYRCLPGRLPALLDRFENVVLRFFDKYEMRQAGFWTTMVGESNHDLTYLMAWESIEELSRKRNAFIADPEWAKLRAQSERDGPIIQTISNQLLLPTPFSSVK